MNLQAIDDCYVLFIALFPRRRADNGERNANIPRSFALRAPSSSSPELETQQCGTKETGEVKS